LLIGQKQTDQSVLYQKLPAGIEYGYAKKSIFNSKKAKKKLRLSVSTTDNLGDLGDTQYC
jgi:hypothetical protein